MAGPEGLEPPASRLEAASSIHLSYGPKYSICSDEICCWPRAFGLSVPTADKPNKELPALKQRDLVPQHIVYRVRVRTENGKAINFLPSEMPVVNAMPICMRPGERENHGSMLGRDIPNLDTPELPHRRRHSDQVERKVLRDRETDLSPRSKQVRNHLPDGQIPFVLSVVSQLSPTEYRADWNASAIPGQLEYRTHEWRQRTDEWRNRGVKQ